LTVSSENLKESEMTVAELINILKAKDQDMVVTICVHGYLPESLSEEGITEEKENVEEIARMVLTNDLSFR